MTPLTRRSIVVVRVREATALETSTKRIRALIGKGH